MKIIKKVIKHTFIYECIDEIIRDVRINNSMIKWTENDQKKLGFYSQFIKPGDICFDIGANIGNRTKIFLKAGTTVVAVEPQDKCMKFLKKVYGNNKHVKLIHKAVGEKEGQCEMMISNVSTISSLSEEWIKAVKESSRFSQYNWVKKEVVQLTTLDKLIDQYGIPAFIKIDVEGYEYQVVKGLTKQVNTLSLEFTPEFLESTFQSINYLSGLGDIYLNYSLYESMDLALQEWLTPHEIIGILSEFRNDNKIFGDLYIKF